MQIPMGPVVKPRTMVAGTNVKTGKTDVGQSVSGCGSRRCAEPDMAAQLGGDDADIVFTNPVRPKSGKLINVCIECQKKFSRSQFPKNKPNGDRFI